MRHLLEDDAYLRSSAYWKKYGVSDISTEPSYAFLDIIYFLIYSFFRVRGSLTLKSFQSMIKNNSPVKISLTCLKSLRLNIAQNFVKLYFTDFEITTPIPMRCCSQQPVFQKYRKKLKKMLSVSILFSGLWLIDNTELACT